MAFAVFNSALNVYGESNEAFNRANIVSNNLLMHKILQLSLGNTGFEGGGDLRGVGSLSEQVYNQLGYNFSTIKDDMGQQLEALIRYIEVGWQGNIREAYIAMLDNNEWGTISLLRHNKRIEDFQFGAAPVFGQ